ncbi:hypothetical protein BGZ67_005636 [Mortierella alpina]|nr:hypothetical protein BGZ67_005636 [Mortierella alpina]
METLSTLLLLLLTSPAEEQAYSKLPAEQPHYNPLSKTEVSPEFILNFETPRSKMPPGFLAHQPWQTDKTPVLKRALENVFMTSTLSVGCLKMRLCFVAYSPVVNP